MAAGTCRRISTTTTEPSEIVQKAGGMKNPVQISLRGIPHSDALETYIGQEVQRLDRVCNRIVSCHLIAEHLQAPGRRQFVVRLNLTLAGTEVAVDRDHDTDVYMAVRSAFDAAAHQLQDYMRRVTHSEHRSRDGNTSPRR